VVDFGYLESFTAGDRQVISEVLVLFLDQAKKWVGGLDATNPGWRDLVHTIKGSARGIGAHGLGDICAQAEAAGSGDLAAVRTSLAAVVAEIEAYLARS
jgi:HPt (histidine-containing phosphotransfer) domain-containing protein